MAIFGVKAFGRSFVGNIEFYYGMIDKVNQNLRGPSFPTSRHPNATSHSHWTSLPTDIN